MGAAVWAALPGPAGASNALWSTGASGGYSPTMMGVRETTPLGWRKKGPIACLFVDCRGNAARKGEIADRLGEIYIRAMDPSCPSAEREALLREQDSLVAELAAIMEREGGCCG